MKLAILTLPLNYNYGGIMQGYALQRVLTNMGHEAVVLDVPRKREDSISPRQRVKRWIKKYMLRKEVAPLPMERKYREDCTIMQNTWRFIDWYVATRIIHSFAELREKDYDGYIVGSDQIWRPCYFKGDFQCGIEQAYLNFAKGWNVKRVVYAASLGTSDWEYTEGETTLCKELVRDFDAVSVREESSVELLKEKFGVKAQLVLDPTLLLSAEEYINQIGIDKVQPSAGNLFYYFLDDNAQKQDTVDYLRTKKSNLIPFTANGLPEDPEAPIELRIQPPLEQWLRGFYDAEIVVTDSFHGSVFSIIFGKPFYVLFNERRGNARIETLLSAFGLEDRIIHSAADIDRVAQNYDVMAVKKRLQELQQKSMKFLEKSLG
ncbi:MAG: polysaccharide pyruvyl transferase family protein [Bacteroidales bacterium]|nr:polysaccharide pyruvyl transferase family protein [Bacteroidales bacterium]